MSESRQLGQLRHRAGKITAPVALPGAGLARLQVCGVLVCGVIVGGVLVCVPVASQAQEPISPSSPTPPVVLPAGTPRSWVDAAASHELAIVQDDSLPLRYKVRKTNAKGDVTRVVIESRQGNVARLIECDGRPLTSAEDAAERKRLNAILQSPEDYLKHERKNDASRDYALQLIKLMPQAMIYTYAPTQPQPPGAQSRQVVLDFHPNPAFKPPSMVSELLTGIEGRVWIDARSGRMTRVEGHVLHTVNFGWGIIAKVYPGGTIELEQTSVGGKRWIYSHLDEDLTLREMMVKLVNDKTKMTAWDFQPLPSPVSFQEAVRELLAMPVKLQ